MNRVLNLMFRATICEPPPPDKKFSFLEQANCSEKVNAATKTEQSVKTAYTNKLFLSFVITGRQARSPFVQGFL